MKASLRTAFQAVTFHVAVVTSIFLLFPLMAYSANLDKAGKLQKSKLSTPQDYMEYASVNDENIHDLYFSTILYEGTESCLMCHKKEGMAALEMGHFKWEDSPNRVTGLESENVGKNNLLNNFCIAVPTNEGRCTQCHAGIGYADKTFDFENPANVDCLVCHDQSGTYKKGPKTAGAPDPTVDLNAVARSIALGSEPQRKNCINCHAKAGGGDNVKHGDISTDLVATTREYDVHMGTDGANMQCTACHGANHNPEDGSYNHGNAGMSLHSVYEGEMKQCDDCHGGQDTIHANTAANLLFEDGWHKKLVCQVCHIPAIARKKPTKMEWYWADAGQDKDVPIDPETGMPTYNKMKGTFVWKNNVRPVLRYSNGTWDRMVINKTDRYTEEPIQMTVPHGDYNDPNAMIYPFKMMIGNQPVDTVNKTVLVPHLFGMKGGPNPYWVKYDWDLALQDGSAYTGQPYSGTYGFASTEMLLSVNHEVAPAENALGYGPMPDACMDCHSTEFIDWDELGWTADPMDGGDRVDAPTAPAMIAAPPSRLD